MIQNTKQFLIEWFLGGGMTVVAIIIVAFILLRFSGVVVDRVVRKAVVGKRFLNDVAERKREDTLINVITGTIKTFVWIIAILMIFSEFGVNIGPMIAAAGVVGLAFGFGGQYLIKDVISGLFIIFENQYRVGDVITIAGVTGAVEDVNLRLTILRDASGVVHHVPNGSISVASNLTKHYSKVNLDIDIAYEADIEEVEKVVNAVGEELAKDSDWADAIISPPQFVRINDFADSAVVIKIVGETQPTEQWAVAGELRKRLKIAFDKNGIDIPYPQQVIRKV
jgi:moderate conductance mechanosensitive channel